MIIDYMYTKIYYAEKLEKFANKIRNYYYDLRLRFYLKRHIVKTTLNPWRWHDADEIMLYSNMAILVDYVEKEQPYVYWDEKHLEKWQNDIMFVYKWWKNYENRLNEIERITRIWCDLSEELHKNENKKVYKIIKGDCDHLFEIIDEMEDKLNKEEAEMLNVLMKYRKYLWT